MKIKILEGFEDHYEDVSLGKLYEVVEERPDYYIIFDDQFDDNTIYKEDCEIVTEETMFKEGDRVKIVVENASDIRTLEDWFLQGKENKVGEIVEIEPDGVLVHSVDLGDGMTWHVPVELLQKDPITTSDNNEKEQQTTTLHQIIQFTQNNKGFSIEFDAGKITLADWSTDPNATFYRPKTLEELLGLMELLEKINEYRCDMCKLED